MKRRLIALLLLFAVPTAFFSACAFNLRQVSGKLARGSQTLVSTLRANDPNHPSLPKWEAFAKGAASFDARVNAGEDPLTLLRALAEMVTSFRQDILPILGNNVALIVAAAVADEAIKTSVNVAVIVAPLDAKNLGAAYAKIRHKSAPVFTIGRSLFDLPHVIMRQLSSGYADSKCVPYVPLVVDVLKVGYAVVGFTAVLVVYHRKIGVGLKEGSSHKPVYEKTLARVIHGKSHFSVAAPRGGAFHQKAIPKVYPSGEFNAADPSQTRDLVHAFVANNVAPLFGSQFFSGKVLISHDNHLLDRCALWLDPFGRRHLSFGSLCILA